MAEKKRIPAPTIRGTYSTYENSKPRDLNTRLGHVVELNLEDLVTIEIGGWSTLLKIRCRKDVKVTEQMKDGVKTIYVHHAD